MTTDTTARLLDFSQDGEAYVQYLDSVVDTFYTTTDTAQQTQARTAIEALQAHAHAWEKVDTILQHSKSEQSKFVALQILEDTIKTRWNVLPEDQQKGIRQFLTNVIISVATTGDAKQRVYLHKLNLVLVQVLKKDWPARWPSFIPELVGASKTSENLCENSMHILRLLSEEVFDFNRGELTQSKTRMLKAQLNSEFESIHELCHFVLRSTDLWSSRPALIKATLSALQVYLTWIPLAYIFNTNLLQILLGLFPLPPFRNLALQCLTEIGSLPEVGEEHNEMFLVLFQHFMGALVQVLPPTLDIAEAYEQGTEDDEQFVQNLALFLTSFLREHLSLIEGAEHLRQQLTTALTYLVKISYVQNSEIFKVCLDYWNKFVPDVFTSVHQYRGGAEPGAAALFSMASNGSTHPRVAIYSDVLKGLRLLMIDRMVRPEEVLVSTDDHGNVVRDYVRDTDSQQQYKTMRETLVYLSHLDFANTEEQMLEKLRTQLGGSLEWDKLNTLCWAIGSISGSMDEHQENQFLVTVIRDLLNLCEVTYGKDNKAIIASNIMYVVGQYPRFLRAHWRFLKTVVNKLFEFMHELHPGVQDMAVETLLKICNKCKRKFVMQHPTESQPFVVELLAGIPDVIKDLSVHQINTFYESVALMIRAEQTNEALRVQYLEQLTKMLNERWQQAMEVAAANEAALAAVDMQQPLHNLLLSNISICKSLGGFFLPQMGKLYAPMLEVYTKYSQLINGGIQAAGPLGAQHAAIKRMRSIKKDTLKLIETFVETSESEEHLAVISQQFVPTLMEPILSDYEKSLPDAKEAEVLSMFAMIINKLRHAMAAHVPVIFAATFECTLDMIKGNYVDYPEHRLQFFSLLQAITNHCFPTLRAMSAAQQGLLIDSIVWAFRHTERNVADTGLQLLSDMLNRFAQERDLMGPFLQSYYLRLMQEIFAVLTDTMHKPGFRLQVKILSQLIGVVKAGMVPVPLWPADAPHASNADFVRDHLLRLLASSFPHMTQHQVAAVVAGMFEHVDDFPAFKNHCRDFLVQTKEFGSSSNDELYAEEAAAEAAARAAAVPGLARPEQAREKDEMGMDG